ncbi:DUF1499 domain-containing protein [Aestuariirhabdus sp. Z084]|uniref:DUF1499 domain-containing protein n=1 Tax=Aestuariirhabdus haliotis TaxID=2918751 RepID=UPI00201B3C98|nr:DUF1499 domain-containing protein [Aestuariirhabdus haliotis]MCL6416611.1 DUF1499 domain-containing protein [Aestuariirhabdus haliotis]MCL6420646.1 DUF1499 domain-containing protein [Aestuariirhabdus haliotis]
MLRTSAVITVTLLLAACGGTQAIKLGVEENRFLPCPESPNCVSSDAQNEEQQVAAFTLAVDPATAWIATKEAVSILPRTKLIELNEHYLHAESESSLLGFIDDLQLHLRPEDGIIAVYSASRTGYSDFGVNRERVENLRAILIERGVVR